MGAHQLVSCAARGGMLPRRDFVRRCPPLEDKLLAAIAEAIQQGDQTTAEQLFDTLTSYHIRNVRREAAMRLVGPLRAGLQQP